MTIDDFVKIGALRSGMRQYAEKRDRAIRLCEEQFRTHKRPYVAISGGKDSVAMAYIVDAAARRVGADYRLWLHCSDASFPGTVETCRKVAAAVGRELDVFESKDSAFDAIARPQKATFGKSGVFFSSVREYAKDKDLCFVGVRAAESRRRMRAAKAHGQVFDSASMGDVTVCHPLLWFTLYDVAAALHEYDAPIHPIYKKITIERGENRCGEESFIRLGYITSRDLLNKGTAVFLRINYPDEFNRLAAAYPEIRLWV